MRFGNLTLAAKFHSRHQLAFAAAAATAEYMALPVNRHGHGPQRVGIWRGPKDFSAARIQPHQTVIQTGIDQLRLTAVLHENRRGVRHLIELPINLPKHLAGRLIQRGNVAGAGVVFIQNNHQILEQHRRHGRAMTIITERYPQLTPPQFLTRFKIMARHEEFIVIAPRGEHPFSVGCWRG